MPSPFPGMDPYLEDPGIWPDFHAKFINYLQESIGDRLPDNYDARINEWVQCVELATDENKDFIPDVSISQNHPLPTNRTASTGIATLEPTTIPLAWIDEVMETYIQIRRRSDNTLITLIEVLSPTNKNSAGYGIYSAKRRALLRQSINLVEIDLLVGGRRHELSRPWPAGHYHVLVAPYDRRPDADIYSWTIQQPLPVIPIPLKVSDPAVFVPLAEPFSTAFDRGRYRRYIGYDSAPIAHFAPDDLKWATEIGAAAAK